MIWTLILLISQAWAGGGGEHAAGHGEIPWNSIFVQAFNLAFLLGLLVYLLRKSVSETFATRARDYQQMVSRAETARLEAEKSKREVKDKLAKLESTADQVVQRARTEAEELRARMMSEAKALTLRMQQEAERTVKVEVEKAKGELRGELMAKATQAARENLQKNMTGTEQTKLQKEFAEKIQVVGG